MYATPAAQGRRTRGGASYPPSRQSIGSTPTGNSSGILPTPDPTVGSCMSEEDKDVALQLMRLGEMSNISHGRTSASTLDDTFSGRADATSSTGATSESESEDELPPLRRQKREPSPILPPGAIKKFRQHLDDILPSQDSTEPSGDEGDYEDGRDETFRPSLQDGRMDLDNDKPKIPKSKSVPSVMGKPRTTTSAAKVKPGKTKAQRPAQVKSKKSNSVSAGAKPISPTSLPPQSRKTSNASALNFQHQLGEDEEDLSSKPRCQRCRKSKKGCDRQRPCQRCKDAGLSADQCVSEDEGNGRKGRYGRHMGVPVKKDEVSMESSILPPTMMAGGQGSPDKSKKRKR
jgi:cell division septation protein DedD